MRVLISGASGFVGTALAEYLEERGVTCIKLVRSKSTPSPNEVFWDPSSHTLPDSSSLEGLDGVVHLSGKNIAACRWSEGAKKLLWESRIGSTVFLTKVLGRLQS